MFFLQQMNFGSICDWLNYSLNSSVEAYHRDAAFQPLVVIPLEKGICLVKVSGDAFTLSDALENFGVSENASNMFATKLMSKYENILLSRKLFEEEMVQAGSISIDYILDGVLVSKRTAFAKMSTLYSSNCLRNQIRQFCPLSDQYYGRSRSFAHQLGLLAAISTALNGPNDFKAENMIFSCRDDRLLLTGSYLFSKTGLRDSSAVDINFRLTKSITCALSPVLVVGPMASCMGTLFNSFINDRSSLEVRLILFFTLQINALINAVLAIALPCIDGVREVFKRGPGYSKCQGKTTISVHVAFE